MILIINKRSAGLPDADNCFPRHLEIFDEGKSLHVATDFMKFISGMYLMKVLDSEKKIYFLSFVKV